MENDQLLYQLCKRYPLLDNVKESIKYAVEIIVNCYSEGGKLLICGNGGSCSDSDHIVGELMKSFESKRPVNKLLKKQLIEVSNERGKYIAEKLEQGLPAISLTAQIALITAISNDIDSDLIFGQQVASYGNTGDVILGLSSSGNSQNVIDAFIVAKAKGLKVIGLTGETGGEMKQFCDILINVPGHRTAFVQELQLPVYHAICLMVEKRFFKK